MNTKERDSAIRTETGRWAEAFRATSAAAINRMATEYVDQKEALKKSEARVAQLEDALRRIVQWGPFPKVPGRNPGEPEMSYGVAYGSNGERDYMRQFASQVLKGD